MGVERKEDQKVRIERSEIAMSKSLSEAEADAFFLKECGADNLNHIPDDQIDKATFKIITELQEKLCSQWKIKHGDLFKLNISSLDIVVYIGFAEIKSKLHWFYFLFMPNKSKKNEKEATPTVKKIVNVSLTKYETELRRKLFATYTEAVNKIQIGG
jgi:hypothetical protein